MRTVEPTSTPAAADLPATVSVRTAGRLLGISRDSAYSAAHRGHLPTLRMGVRLLVPTALLRDMLGMTDSELASRLANPVAGER